MNLFCYWMLVVACIPWFLGSLVTKIIDILIRKDLKKRASKRRWDRIEDYEKATERIGWQPFVLGLIERTAFCVYLGSYSYLASSSNDRIDLPQGIFLGALYWITLKLAIGWKRVVGIEVWKRILAFSALINSIISISIGVLGGWIIKDGILYAFLEESIYKCGVFLPLVIVVILCIMTYKLYGLGNTEDH